jgi:hypothetical protein
MPAHPSEKPSVKQRISHELRAYLVNFAFLAVVLVSITTYRGLALAEYHVSAFQYGWAVVESLILAKLVLIGEAIHLGDGLQDGPIVVSMLWKTLVFMVFVAAFMLAEHSVKAFLHHRTVREEVGLTPASELEMLARLQLMFVAFLPLFAYRELGRVLGQERLDALLLRRRPAGSATRAPS